MRALLFLLLIISGHIMAAAPSVTIIIDDIGNDYMAAQQALDLPTSVTLAILPQLQNSRRIAEQAHKQGREVMLHQPMQSKSDKAMGPGGLNMLQSESDYRMVLRKNLSSVPHVIGVNNHMGSVLTASSFAMQWFMNVLKQQKPLFFLDSRTTKKTQAQKMAVAAGIATAKRDVFLDNIKSKEQIRNKLNEVLALAKTKGTAIAIGHPYPETLAVLAEVLPEWKKRGIILLSVSEMIDQQQRPVSWSVSMSSLHKAAKNTNLQPN